MMMLNYAVNPLKKNNKQQSVTKQLGEKKKKKRNFKHSVYTILYCV